MKAVYVVILSLAMGVALGAGISWANFGDVSRFSTGGPVEPDSASVPGKRPKAVVDNQVFNFGPVERDEKVRHAFRFTNAGDGPLTLKAGVTTCTKCTIAQLSKSTLAPGESTDVTVEYLPTTAQPRFRQVAPILTNDPENPRVELAIFGTVTAKYVVVPESLVLGKVSANETRIATIKMYAFLSEDVGLADHAFTDAETAAYFEARSEPIPRDELTEPDAKSGCRVLVTIKPGLPLGPFRQTIRLDFRLDPSAEKVTVEVPIQGTIDSDISIVGPGWDADQARLSIGAVKSSRGATRKLLLILRGEHRHEVAIKPEKVDPSWLKVTLGEPSDLEAATVTQIPLTIEIPPGVPLANHLGSDQGKYAEVILETTHPQVKQIRMYLRFVIEP